MTSYEMTSLEWRVRTSHQEALVAMQRFCDKVSPVEKQEPKSEWERQA